MFRRGLVCLAFACTCASALGACSLLLDDDLSAPSTPSADDSGTDATNAVVDGSNPTPDGGPTIDGSLAVFDGGKLSCPDAAGVLCDDFERNELVGPWGATNVSEAGSIEIKAAGAGKRFEAAITSADNVAQLSKDLTVSPSRIHIELTLEILTLPSAGGIYITGALMFNPPNPLTLFYLYAHGGGAFIVEQLTDESHYVQTPVAITLNAPHRVVMDIQAGGKLTVTVDGATQVDKNTESWIVLKPPSAILGPGSLNGGNAFAMRADDYVFIAQ